MIKINDLLRILFLTHSEYWCQVIVCDDYALQMDVFWLFNVIWKICTTLMLKRHNMLSWHKGIVEIAPDQKAREDVSHAEPVIDMEFTNTAPHTIILTFCCILSVSGCPCPSTWGMSLFLGEMNSGGKVWVFQGLSLFADYKCLCEQFWSHLLFLLQNSLEASVHSHTQL